jgi:hypothetical protein
VKLVIVRAAVFGEDFMVIHCLSLRKWLAVLGGEIEVIDQ